MVALSQLFMSGYLEKDSHDSITCQALMGELMRIDKAVDAFTTRLRGIVREKATEELEAVRAEGRAKEKEISDMRATATEWAQEKLRMQDVEAKALSVLHGAQQRRKELGRFTSRKEIDAADEAIEKAIPKVDAANAKITECQSQINTIALVELPKLQRELDVIDAREKELQSDITGQAFCDRLGILRGRRAPL
jgi:uncharacterized protein YhaN